MTGAPTGRAGRAVVRRRGDARVGTTRHSGRMRVASARRLAAAVTVLGALAACASASAASTFSPCTSSAKDRTLCGQVAVPLDRSGAVPGAIDLRVRVLEPAHGTPSATIVALAGGPGQAAVPLLGGFEQTLAPVLRTRQLVVFDQRGTGGSGRISCSSLAREGDAVTAIADCASQLGPARADYTTAASVEDVEAVRVALRVDRLIVYGTSYGTKVALGYAAAYPQHVDRLVLDSIVPPGGVDPFQRATIGSIPRVLRTICSHACRFTRDPDADLAALVRRLGRAPLRGSAFDASGRRRSMRLTRVGLLSLMLDGDFDPYLRAGIPAAVRAALDGDAAPLLRLVVNDGSGEGSASADSDAVFVATTCEDGGVPWTPGTPLAARRALVNAAAAAIGDGAFAPFDRTTVRELGTADLCRSWPEAPIVQPQPALPPTPALILSGDEDLRTPRADALALTRALPGAHLLQVQDSGHGVLFSDPTDCAERALAAFIGGAVPGACRAHPPIVAALPLAPLRLGSLTSYKGLATLNGRTVRAVQQTLDDVSGQVFGRVASGNTDADAFGGLRGGSATIGRSGLRLRDYAYVPGVTVSGLLPAKGHRLTLTIGGADAAHGRLVLTPKGIDGTLDGAPVALGAKALGWRVATAVAYAPLRRAVPGGPASWLPLELRPDSAVFRGR